MTTQQILVTLAAYAIALLAAIRFTRPSRRRSLGALAGGAAAACLLFAAALLGNAAGWWKVSFPSTAYLLALFYLTAAISCAPIYLITWRVAARFGSRGITVCLIVSAVIGPPRDYLISTVYPEWITFAPGLAPIAADAATYSGIVGLGHAAMWLVSGPSKMDLPQ